MSKNHQRAPGKKGFSVALPTKLLETIQTIARKETRNRNSQIEHFLSDAVDRYQKANPIPLPVDPSDSKHKPPEPLKSVPDPPTRRKKA